MPTTDIDILTEINSISKIHSLKRDDIDIIMVEFAERISVTLKIERVSVWIFSPDSENLVSLGEYEHLTQSFTKGKIIKKDECPNYFKSIGANEILVADNVRTTDYLKELKSSYLDKHNVISLMDVPLRIDGDLVGVICYEKVGDTERVFSDKDKLFALSVGFVFASNLEARHRRIIQKELDEELKKKTVLIKEINHRVKNNIAVISSLINMQVQKSKDDYHKLLFEEFRNKIEAIASIHRITCNSEDFDHVNIQDFVEDLIQDILEFYSHKEQAVVIAQEIESTLISFDKATPLALIINEVITNSYKHAFDGSKDGLVTIKISSEGENVSMEIKDNGIGFKMENIREESVGIEIIQGLVEQLDGEMQYEIDNGTKFLLNFQK